MSDYKFTDYFLNEVSTKTTIPEKRMVCSDSGNSAKI